MQEIDIEELLKIREQKPNLVVLDCRGSDYWNWERIPGSRNLRWKYITEQALKIFPDRSIPIVTYCDGITCPASRKAYEALINLGYHSVFEYSAGLADWKAHGHSTEFDANYKIASNVYSFPEQRFYGSLVNCYLIDEDDCLILIDGPQQLIDEHEDFILNFGKPIKVILTHAATGTCSDTLRSRLNAQIFLHHADKKDEWLSSEPDQWLKGNEKFSSSLTIVHTPGHSAGSISIVDTRNRFLFSGDHLAGNIQGQLRDVREDTHARGNIQQRLDSISNLLNYEFDAIFPFHYQAIRSKAHAQLKDYLKGVNYGKN